MWKPFQSTLPRGERPIVTTTTLKRSWHFNPRSRVGSDVPPHLVDVAKDDDFNPRSRVGSDCRLTLPERLSRISIHAPAWGATDLINACNVADTFQSTLPRGERPATFPADTANDEFQSTLPRGERQQLARYKDWHDVFQSTLPRGERLLSEQAPARTSRFQSTLPRGERHIQGRQNDKDRIISIHAPAWGATGCRVLHAP